MDLQDLLLDKPLPQSFILVLVTLLVSAVGLMVGFFVRDFFLELLRRSNLYDCDKGFKDLGLTWLFLIPVVSVIVCSLFIVYMYRLAYKVR
jgi:hypothetical protein